MNVSFTLLEIFMSKSILSIVDEKKWEPHTHAEIEALKYRCKNVERTVQVPLFVQLFAKIWTVSRYVIETTWKRDSPMPNIDHMINSYMYLWTVCSRWFHSWEVKIKNAKIMSLPPNSICFFFSLNTLLSKVEYFRDRQLFWNARKSNRLRSNWLQNQKRIGKLYHPAYERCHIKKPFYNVDLWENLAR